ncbi:unnamed protein product [Adineta steineri]|uniref:Uncharacterized protein n=1 Tax=Adineta steineri TaxID=433720 RepID=A0A816EJ88_9BILA|nr:unnamed protein product [Adineta steineri]CAF1653577.1 unnamed protein product [Adineta steineri]
MTLLLGNRNGTFQKPIIFLFQNFKSLTHLHVADFNNDNRSDLIFMHQGEENSVWTERIYVFTILLGDSNETFQTQNMLSRVMPQSPLQISVIDLNNDKKVDIVMIRENDCNVYVMFGYGNTTFSSEIILSVGVKCDLRGLVVSDVNNDNYFDIVVYNHQSLHIYVFFGKGNEAFQPPKWLFTTSNVGSAKIVIGDFNNDDQSDIGFIYINWKDLVYMIYQYKNNSFSVNEKTIIKSNQNLHSAVVGDINGDNHLDIIINLIDPCRIYALLGYGNGKFSIQTIYSNESQLGYKWLSVTNFNNYNYQDIISVDTHSKLINIFLNKRQCLAT